MQRWWGRAACPLEHPWGRTAEGAEQSSIHTGLDVGLEGLSTLRTRQDEGWFLPPKRCWRGEQIGADLPAWRASGAVSSRHTAQSRSRCCLCFTISCTTAMPKFLLPVAIATAIAMSPGQERCQLLGRQCSSQLSPAHRTNWIALGLNGQLQQPPSTSKPSLPKQTPGLGRVFPLQWRSRARAPCSHLGNRRCQAGGGGGWWFCSSTQKWFWGSEKWKASHGAFGPEGDVVSLNDG